MRWYDQNVPVVDARSDAGIYRARAESEGSAYMSGTNTTNQWERISTDASRVTSVYTNSGLVHPTSLTMNYVVKS